MKSAWEGDGRFFLPLKKVEPYRLWFEFLKLALNDPNIEVDRDFYADWGDVEGQVFSKWWAGPTWRTLFAVDTFSNAVRVVQEDEEITPSDDMITVRISLKKDPNESLRDLRDLLREYKAKAVTAAKPRFSLSGPGNLHQGFLIPQRLGSVRLMRRLYEAWLKHQELGNTRRVQRATIDVYEWAKAWNDKLEERDWKREKTYLPDCFEIYATYLLRAEAVRQRTGKRSLQREERPTDDVGGDPEGGRRQVVRWITKAKNLAKNVAEGEFPGSY